MTFSLNRLGRSELSALAGQRRGHLPGRDAADADRRPAADDEQRQGSDGANAQPYASLRAVDHERGRGRSVAQARRGIREPHRGCPPRRASAIVRAPARCARVRQCGPAAMARPKKSAMPPSTSCAPIATSTRPMKRATMAWPRIPRRCCTQPDERQHQPDDHRHDGDREQHHRRPAGARGARGHRHGGDDGAGPGDERHRHRDDELVGGRCARPPRRAAPRARCAACRGRSG